MPSRLSSLLVRDGLVGVKRMEKAFQRQVIYGGSLDTILLEMDLIPEDRLIQYLALASGLPPAARDEGERIEAGAVALISRELAEQYRAVPVALEGDAVRVLVCAPLEISQLEDLADLLDRGLQPLIAPEYRWNLVFAAAYGLDPPARFTQLARTLDGDTGTPAVGRPPSVIVAGDPAAADGLDTDGDEDEDADTVMSAQPPVAPDADTLRIPGASRSSAAEAPDPSRRSTMIGLTPNRARTDAGAEPGDAPPGTSSPGTQSRRAFPRAPSAPISTEGRDSPLPIVQAREMLATAEDRDTVFLTMLRAARGRARWAGLLTIQGGAAIGRVALAEPGLDAAAVATVLIPLDVKSPFHNVVATRQSHIGSLASGDAGIDAMVARMGGTLPPSGLILPIVLRERVVAVVVAHRVQSDLRLVDVTELLPIGIATSDALARLLVKHKAAGYRAPSEPPIGAEIEPDTLVTKRLTRPTPAPPVADEPAPAESGRWSAPDRPELPDFSGIDFGTDDFTFSADDPTPIDDILWIIETAREGSQQSEDAFSEAVFRTPETLEALGKRFPGKLRTDRFAVSGRVLRPAQYGGLLELVIRLGNITSDMLIRMLAATQRDVRFYAAVCIVELRPRNAVYVLAERLFDQDYGVRACAIEALSHYSSQDLEYAFSRGRSALGSPDPEVVGAAAAAIVQLGDVNAIEGLIGAVERGGRGGEHIRRALVALTAQDFGTSERKWRKWWDGARRRHRVEWLIEGLGHKDEPIRESAIHELRRLTGEYFGYHYDLPRAEREAAAERWAAWWRETGHRRFAPPVSERHRPTAKLPIREG